MISLLNKYNVKVIIDEKGCEWFQADDVGKVLGLENIRRQLNRVVKEKYRMKFNNSNVANCPIRNFKEELPNRGQNFIKAQAVYQIAFRSNKPDAIEFTEWVSEVIELIRNNRYFIADEKTDIWLGARADSKEVRKSETDTIKEFVEYAKSQGSSKPNWYYKHFTNLVRKKLEIPKDLKRDDMSQKILRDIQALETIISMKLNKLLLKDKDYKEIYKTVKEMIEMI